MPADPRGSQRPWAITGSCSQHPRQAWLMLRWRSLATSIGGGDLLDADPRGFLRVQWRRLRQILRVAGLEGFLLGGPGSLTGAVHIHQRYFTGGVDEMLNITDATISGSRWSRWRVACRQCCDDTCGTRKHARLQCECVTNRVGSGTDPAVIARALLSINGASVVCPQTARRSLGTTKGANRSPSSRCPSTGRLPRLKRSVGQAGYDSYYTTQNSHVSIQMMQTHRSASPYWAGTRPDVRRRQQQQHPLQKDSTSFDLLAERWRVSDR
jgi:hypothetical protein